MRILAVFTIIANILTQEEYEHFRKYNQNIEFPTLKTFTLVKPISSRAQAAHFMVLPVS